MNVKQGIAIDEFMSSVSGIVRVNKSSSVRIDFTLISSDGKLLKPSQMLDSLNVPSGCSILNVILQYFESNVLRINDASIKI